MIVRDLQRMSFRGTGTLPSHYIKRSNTTLHVHSYVVVTETLLVHIGTLLYHLDLEWCPESVSLTPEL